MSEEETDDEPFDFDAFMRENDKKGEKSNGAASEPAVAFAPPPERSQTSSSTEASGEVDKRKWLNVILEVEKSCKPLTGMLTGSTVRTAGNTLIVKPSSPKIKMFFDDAFISSKIAPCAESVLGKHYDVKLEY